MTKSIRNPILNVDYYDIENNLQTCRIQLIGDPHFGKTFKTGVPSSKIGLREKSQFEDFKNLLLTNDVNEYVIVGDLFDKFSVPNNILLQIKDLLLTIFLKKPHLKCHIICGNHDLSKDKTKVSSFEIFSHLINENPLLTNVFVYTKSTLYTYVDKKGPTNLKFYFDAYDPFYEETDLNEKFINNFSNKIETNDKIISFGHWDDPRKKEGYLPPKSLIDVSFSLVSGHYHIPEKIKINKKEFFYTGSLQPYNHGEDLESILYETISYSDLEDLFKNKKINKIKKLEQKNVRVNCYPGYIFPYTLDCMSFIYNNILDIPKEITEDFEVIDISNTELTDFTTLYLHKLKTEHNISEELLLKINNFLKDDTNVSFSID